MQQAFGEHPGALHRELNVPEGETIPKKKITAAKKKAAKTGDTHLAKQLNLAKRGEEANHSAQDTAILGLANGKPGGHCGYGKGVASYGTEAEEKKDDDRNVLSGQYFGQPMDDNPHSQSNAKTPSA